MEAEEEPPVPAAAAPSPPTPHPAPPPPPTPEPSHPPPEPAHPTPAPNPYPAPAPPNPDAPCPARPAGGGGAEAGAGVGAGPRPSRDSRKLDCIVCYCAFNLGERLPRRLYCGHTFCQACLRRLDTVLNEQMWIPCPQCRQNTPVPRGGATALDLDLAAFLGVKADLEGHQRGPRAGQGVAEAGGGASRLEHKRSSLGKQSVMEQPPGSAWAHGGLAEPRFHRRPCCRRRLFCCWWCC